MAVPKSRTSPRKRFALLEIKAQVLNLSELSPNSELSLTLSQASILTEGDAWENRSARALCFISSAPRSTSKKPIYARNKPYLSANCVEVAGVLGISPGFKFDPDEDELVEFYLTRRLLGQQLPFDGVILEDDPRSTAPWTLMDKHGRKEEAFFFASAQSVNDKGSRHQKRTCTGGERWEGQKVIVDDKPLFVRDSGIEIKWRKYLLNFHAGGGTSSSGWVMHEYSVTSPPELASSPLRLYCILVSAHGKNKRKRGTQDSSGDQGAARGAARRATATPEPDLLCNAEQHHPSASRSDFLPVVASDHLGASAEPAATSSLEYGSSGVTNDLPLPDHVLSDDTDEAFAYLEDIVLPEGWFLPGADMGAEAAATSSEQDNPAGAIVDFSSADGAAAPAAWSTPSLDQGFFDSAINDGMFFDSEVPTNMDFSYFLTYPELGAWGLQAADAAGEAPSQGADAAAT